MTEIKPKTKEEIAAAYSSSPWWYDVRGFFILTFAYRSTLWRQISFFGNNIRNTHMEVAIGTGTLYGMIHRWRRWRKLPQCRIVGVDYALPMLAGAQRRFAGVEGVGLQHADVANLPYDDETFDTANIANAVHCFPDVDGGLKDVYRVLKPNGTLAANVLLYPRGPAPLKWLAQKIDDWGIRKGILYTPYELEDIRARIEAVGFTVSFEEVSGNTYNVMATKAVDVG